CSFSLSHLPPPAQRSPLSLHDALPISSIFASPTGAPVRTAVTVSGRALSIPAIVEWAATQYVQRFSVLTAISTSCRSVAERAPLDRKSTRLNSSHQIISYAVFCLKKKT